METITINPRLKGQWQSEWRYYHLVYLEGETSNNAILMDVALQRFFRLLQEVFNSGFYLEDLELPNLKLIIQQLKDKGYKLATKHRPDTN